MALNLKKGEGLKLRKEDGSLLNNIAVAIGWKGKKYDTQADFDLDLTAFVLGADEMSIGEEWVAFYHQQSCPGGVIKHSGDQKIGGAVATDLETIVIPSLSALPENAKEIAFVVTIYDAVARKQTFGQVDGAYIRLMDMDKGGEELARFDLEEDGGRATAVAFAEIKRNNDGHWTFKTVGEGFEKGLEDFVKMFGLQVAD
jgi:tellurium resistance protein TerD